MATSKYKLNTDSATWIDVNSRYTLDSLPDRLADDVAIIHSSIFNLMNCLPGQRARIFQPEYGSRWMSFLQEPISDLTAAKMQLMMFDSLRRWEPRIQLDLNQSSIEPDTNIPGYVVRISFRMPNLASTQQIQFEVTL